MYVATNVTDGSITFRDDAGKHVIAPGASLVLDGKQHAPAAISAGLQVEWTTTAPTQPSVVASANVASADASSVPRTRKRQAKVTARDA